MNVLFATLDWVKLSLSSINSFNLHNNSENRHILPILQMRNPSFCEVRCLSKVTVRLGVDAELKPRPVFVRRASDSTILESQSVLSVD